MGDIFLERIVKEIESFERKGWVAEIIGNFPWEEKLYITNPEGWRRNEEYYKIENYVGASEDRKNTIIFSKLCKAAYKYFPQLWSDSIIGY